MAAKVLSEEFAYYNFTQEYYFKQISSNSWIQSMNIEQDIIDQIATFSIGILRDCNNDKCIYGILIANHHRTRALARRRAISESERSEPQ